MKLDEIKKNFEIGAKEDPLGTVLSFNKKWNIDEFFDVGRAEIKEVMDYIKDMNLELEKKKVLDFGCGVGRLSQALAPFFEEVYGVDISENMINLANQYNKFGKKCKYIVNTEDNLKIFPDNFFDFIYSNITLQHMDNKYALNYIKEFLRILKPKSLIIFQIPSRRIRKPNEKRIVFFIKNSLYNLSPEKLINFYKKKKWGVVVNMHPIKKEKIINFIEENNGRVLDVIKNNWGGERYESLRYCVTK